jgi:hypothetical protein
VFVSAKICPAPPLTHRQDFQKTRNQRSDSENSIGSMCPPPILANTGTALAQKTGPIGARLRPSGVRLCQSWEPARDSVALFFKSAGRVLLNSIDIRFVGLARQETPPVKPNEVRLHRGRLMKTAFTFLFVIAMAGTCGPSRGAPEETFGPHLPCSSRSQRQFHCSGPDLGPGSGSSTGCCLSRAAIGACLRPAIVLA